MIIHSIKLQNIRSYISEVINFSEGSTLLLGDIGSGKTTILLSIEFAIFGILRGSVTGSTLLRHGKNQGSVELNLSIDNKNVTIKRFLKRGKNIAQDSGFIIIDGIKTDATPVELKSMILELLGYPDELLTKNKSLIFRYTVYTPQEEMKTILFEEKDERLNTLRKVFGIDKYKRIQENGAILLKNIKQRLSILETRLEGLNEIINSFDNYKKQEQKLVLDLNLLVTKKNDIQKEIRALKEIIEDLEKKTSEQKLLKQELEILEKTISENKIKASRQKKDLDEIDTKISNLKQEIDSISQVKYSKEELEQKEKSVQDTINIIKFKISSLSEILTNLKLENEKIVVQDTRELEREKSILLQSNKTIENLNTEEIKLSETLEDMNSILGSIQESINESQKTIGNLEGIDRCPTCLQKIDSKHKHKIIETETSNISEKRLNFQVKSREREELKENIQRLKKEMEDINERRFRFNEISSIIQKENESLKRKNELEKSINEKKGELEKFQIIDIEEKERYLSKLRKALVNYKIREEKLSLLEEYENSKKKILRALTELEDGNVEAIKRISFIGKRIGEFFNLDKLEEYKDQYDEKNAKEKETLIKEAEIRKEKEIVIKNIKEYQVKIDELKIIEKQYLVEKNFVNWLENSFLNSIINIEKHVMATIHSEFSDLLKEWLGLLMEDETITISLNDEFTPIIEQNGYDSAVENLSGGEKTSLALAYRLALNRVINDFINSIKTKDLLILDEPTDGFSSEQLDRLRDVLEKLFVKQIIIVSHEQKLESYMNNIIRVVKQDHISKII